MILEMRTYTLKPHTLAKLLERFAEKLPERQKLSPLGGFWHTEIGGLNKIIHLWPYKDLAERDRIRGEAIAKKIWPPATHEFLMEMETKIIIPAPFSPPLGEKQLGPIYEFRSYTYAPATIPEVIKIWGEKVGERVKLSPLVFAGHTEIGPLNNWVHVWAYKDLNERARVRAEAIQKGVWPPGAPGLVRQENLIALPASFSPLR